MYEVPATFIAGLPEQLPAAYLSLVDEKIPLPPDVVFYEKQMTISDMINTLLMGLGLTACGAFLILTRLFKHQFGSDIDAIGELMGMFYPWLVGAVFLFAAYFIFSSLGKRWRVMRAQQNGVASRIGIFITPATLFEANEFGYCIIPRADFKGAVGGVVKYMFKGAEKSFKLPDAIINSDILKVQLAIRAWAGLAVQETGAARTVQCV